MDGTLKILHIGIVLGVNLVGPDMTPTVEALMKKWELTSQDLVMTGGLIAAAKDVLEVTLELEKF